MGSYSVVLRVRCLMGQPIYCSVVIYQCWGMGRERLRWLIHYACLISIVLLPWLPGFLHRHVPPQSPPSCPLGPSVHSQQQSLPWDSSSTLTLQLPAAVASRGPASLSRAHMAAARTVWFSFHLGCHRSASSLSVLTVGPSNCPDVGIGPLLQFPHLLRADPVLLTLLFFPLVPSSYRVLCGSVYSFLVVKYSVCSQLVFCKHFCVWRCTPDVSVERDVLHVQLLLRHLVPASCHLVISF